MNVELITMQSNDRRRIVDAFQKHMDDVNGALINGGRLSFSSVSIHDVIKAMPFPVIEVHISNLGTRDEIHQHSILTPAVRGTVMGLGLALVYRGAARTRRNRARRESRQALNFASIDRIGG